MKVKISYFLHNRYSITTEKFCNTFEVYIVAYLLKARTVESKEEPLLVNGSVAAKETMGTESTARQ
jgi:hypothetical protein